MSFDDLIKAKHPHSWLRFERGEIGAAPARLPACHTGASDDASAALQQPRVAVLLDIMNTLVHDPFYQEFPSYFDMSFDDLIKAKHPHSWLRFERGEIGAEDFAAEFWAEQERNRTEPVDASALLAHVSSHYRLLDGAERVLARLRATEGVSVHALSNYPVWYRAIEDKLALSRYLHWSFVSCHTGVRKPDRAAYAGPAAHLGLQPCDCALVDDSQANCEAAEEFGMVAVHFSGWMDGPGGGAEAQLERVLAARGVTLAPHPGE
jgi:HAD superfamily hydrolase (TIGR01509 family)